MQTDSGKRVGKKNLDIWQRQLIFREANRLQQFVIRWRRAMKRRIREAVLKSLVRY